MPQNVTANVIVSAKIDEVIANGISSGDVIATLAYTQAFGAGTGAGNIQRSWTKSATAAISTPDVYVLSGLVDDQGRTIPLAKVRAVIVLNLGATELILGNATTNPWAAPFGSATDRIRCPAGGAVVLVAPGVAGLGVVSGSSDQLKVDPGAAACAYQLVFLGE